MGVVCTGRRQRWQARKVFYVSDWESGCASWRHPIWEAESYDGLNSLGDDCCSRHCVFILVTRWRCGHLHEHASDSRGTPENSNSIVTCTAAWSPVLTATRRRWGHLLPVRE